MSGPMQPAVTVPALLRQAARCRALSGRELSILVELCQLLDVVEYRQVRMWFVADRVGLHYSGVSRAVAHLEALGFLERAPIHDAAREQRVRYRLVLPAHEAPRAA